MVQGIGAGLLGGAILFAGLSLGCMIPAQNTSTAGSGMPGRPLPNGWVVVQNAAIGMRLEIPKGVQIETTEGWTDDGVPLRTHVGRSVLRDRAVFTFYVNEVEGGVIGDPADRLGAISDAYLDEVDRFDIVRTQPLVRDGLPGLRIEFQKPSDDLVLKAEHFVGRTREYTLVVGMPENQVASLATMVEHYFESARFAATDASIPTGDGSFAPGQWSYVTPARDRFSVSFPGNVSLVEAETTLGDEDADVRTYAVVSADGRTAFRARVLRFESGPPDGAFELLTAKLTESGYTLGERWDEPQQGYAGLRLQYRTATLQGEVYWVVTRSRVYELVVEHAPERAAETEPLRRRFFHSLRIH